MSSFQGEGRQSPDPETQTGAQQKSPPGDAKIGTGPEGHADAKGAAEHDKDNVLASNPDHPLDEHAEAKTSKDGRGPGI